MYSVLSIILMIVLFLIILGVIGSRIADRRFNKKVENEIDELFDYNQWIEEGSIEESDLEDLPDNVRKWLKDSNVVDNDIVNTVRLKQKAEMRLDRDKSWMPVDAEQYFKVNEPGFIWKARIKAAPLIHIVGRDKYHRGHGNMLIKLMSMIPIADDSGQEMDQGTLLRFLAESVWFPTAALSDYIEWEKLDDDSAKATMSYGCITSSGVFTFNDVGEVIKFEADRYRENNGKYSKERWVVEMSDHKKIDGLKIPAKGEVTWELDSGDFTWFRFEINELEYNTPEQY